MIVQLIADVNDVPPRLSPNRQYTVIGIEADWYRIINDGREPCLYDRDLFDVRNSAEPGFWITSFGDEGERYSYPVEFSAPGFFEDWHDGNIEARSIFDSVIASRFGMTLAT